MEPFPKRQRLYPPIERSFPQSFDDEPAYYDELGDDLLDEEDYDEEEEETETGYDPEAELDQKRARLDYKLKSTFESIFEKYERDFDGVGDEIDLETGEIVVNNGHIVRMVDEQDAGDSSRAGRVLREFTQEPDELPSSSLDETEIMEDEMEDEEEDELMSDEEIVDDDMAEDDLILRGFAKANRFQQGSQELSASNIPMAPGRAQRREETRLPAPLPRPAPAKSLPSRADIMAQFGPQLGPQIVDYVSQQHVAEDRHVESAWRAPELPKKSAATRNIEPAWRIPALPAAAPRRVESAWRVPGLPTAASVRRPVQRLMTILPDEERSPSPEASASIWAPARSRGRRRLDGADNTALFRGESRAPFHGQKSNLNPIGYRPSQINAQETAAPIKKRLAFTAEEDDVLSEWVSKLRRHGHALTRRRWREFAAEYPRHSASTWQARYVRMFTYLSSNQVEDSDASNSDVSVENVRKHPHTAIRHMEPQYDSDQVTRERPNRIRKPAQTDPRILSWNQAVDSIESVDPVLHAGIMEDARRANNLPQQYMSRRRDDQIVDDSEVDTPIQSQEVTPPTEIRRSYDNLPIRSSLAVETTPEEEDFLIPGAPCPHADCKLHPSTLYKLQRREHEELSEMCLHLFQIHHTTPFPCGEIGCAKKGEDGFFMQLDLVKHVRGAHKNVSALYRLRGRVDPALLKQQAIAKPGVTSDPMQRPVSRRDSDFMSTQKGYGRNLSSSQPAGFDPDRTLTPRGMAGMSTFTPMTSVSSLKVHHPSATSVAVRNMSNSQDRTISDSQVDSSQMMSSQPTMETVPMQTRVAPGELQGFSEIVNQQVESELLMPSREPLGTDSEMLPNSEPASRERDGVQKTSESLGGAKDSTLGTLSQRGPTSQSREQISEPDTTIQGASQIATSSIVRPVLEQAIVEGELSSNLNSSSPALPKQTQRLPTITRNKVDSAYEFSDEELEVRPPTIATIPQLSTPKTGPKQRAKVPIVPASISSRPVTSMPTPRLVAELPVGGRIGALKAIAKPLATPGGDIRAPAAIGPPSGSSGRREKPALKPVATPAAKIYSRARSEDVDELSLGVDEFILLSSRQRTHPLPIPQIGIKHEELVDSPALLSVPATRKRKLDAIRDHTSDELSVFTQTSQDLTIIKPTIKAETDEPLLPIARPIMPKRRGRPPKNPDVAESSSSQIRSSRAPEIMHAVTSTPLLDLTPVRNARHNAERMKEIGDSEAEGEASDPESPSHRPRQRARGQTARPVDFSNMPPITKSRWNRDSLTAERVSVLVKTPGGTMRRCGVDGYECRRSFCFRCEGKGKGEGKELDTVVG